MSLQICVPFLIFSLIVAHLAGRGKPSSCKEEKEELETTMAASPPANGSARDLFSASTNKLEPLPKSESQIEREGQEHQQSLRDEKEWLDAMIERADRGKT